MWRKVPEKLRVCITPVAALCAIFATPVAAADIVIGVPAWPSAQVTANIIASVMRSDLDVESELVDRGTLTILGSIDSGTVQVHPEVWLPNLNDAVERFSKENGTLQLSPQGVPAAQNICVTGETVEQTGIKKIQDLADPTIAAHFDTDGDGKGEIWIGAPSWSSTVIEKVRAKSYGYDQTMTLLEAPEEVAMAAIDVSDSLGQPIVFYCYSPHHVFRLHDIRMLEEPAHDPSNWSIVSSVDDPKWLEKSSAGSGWDQSRYHVGYASSLQSSDPKVAAFLDKVTIGPDDAADMSYAIEVERKTPAEVAEKWIADNRARIEEWTQ